MEAIPLLPSPESIAKLDDEEVAAIFGAIRWPDSPRCPKCSGAKVYNIKRSGHPANWRCKRCRFNFTLTSGTVFASAKKPLRIILSIVSAVQRGKGEVVIRRMAAEMGLDYKVCYALAGKAQEFLGGKINGASVFVGYMTNRAAGGPVPIAPRMQINVADGQRRCTKCGVSRPEDEFTRKAGAPGQWGLRTAVCKPCVAASSGAAIAATWAERRAADAATPIIERSATAILAEAAARPQWWWSRSNWTGQEKHDLRALCNANTPIGTASDALHRSPAGIAWYARDLGLALPPDWKKIVAPKRLYVPKAPRLNFAYPFVDRATPRADDLLRVNALVPRAFPEHMRADICQGVLLALYEGTVTMAELEANRHKLRWFVKKWYREQAPYREVSVGGIDDDRSYDEIAADVKSEGIHAALNEARRMSEAWDNFVPALQEEHVFQREVIAITRGLSAAGSSLSRFEVQGDIALDKYKIADFADLYRGWSRESDQFPTHARDRFAKRYGINLTDEKADAVRRYCRDREPDYDSIRTGDGEHHLMEWGGRRGYIVYRRKTDTVVTVIAYEDFDPVPLRPHHSSAAYDTN